MSSEEDILPHQSRRVEISIASSSPIRDYEIGKDIYLADTNWWMKSQNTNPESSPVWKKAQRIENL